MAVRGERVATTEKRAVKAMKIYTSQIKISEISVISDSYKLY